MPDHTIDMSKDGHYKMMHAVNFCLTDRDEVWFFDPQNDSILWRSDQPVPYVFADDYVVWKMDII